MSYQHYQNFNQNQNGYGYRYVPLPQPQLPSVTPQNVFMPRVPFPNTPVPREINFYPDPKPTRPTQNSQHFFTNPTELSRENGTFEEPKDIENQLEQVKDQGVDLDAAVDYAEDVSDTGSDFDVVDETNDDVDPGDEQYEGDETYGEETEQYEGDDTYEDAEEVEDTNDEYEVQLRYYRDMLDVELKKIKSEYSWEIDYNRNNISTMRSIIDILHGNIQSEYKRDTDLYSTLGCYYLREGDHDKAILYLEMAVEVGHTDAALILAHIYDPYLNDDSPETESEDVDKAIKYYKIASDGGKARADWGLAELLYHIDDYSGSLKYYARLNGTEYFTDDTMNAMLFVLDNMGVTSEILGKLLGGYND